MKVQVLTSISGGKNHKNVTSFMFLCKKCCRTENTERIVYSVYMPTLRQGSPEQPEYASLGIQGGSCTQPLQKHRLFDASHKKKVRNTSAST